MDDESTCMGDGMTVTFQCGEIWPIYILLLLLVSNSLQFDKKYDVPSAERQRDC